MDKEKSITIAIDVDGVLRNNLGEMVRLYNNAFNDNKTIDEIREFKCEVSFPRIHELTGETASSWFFQKHSKELFVEALPYKDVVNDIKRLHEFAEIIIVTYQKTKLNKIQTLEWLEKNDIEYDGICFLKDKTKVHCDYFVDDNDWNFIGCNCSNGALVAAPYNVGKDMKLIKSKSNCKTLKRYNSFHEFANNIAKKYENG